MTSEVTRLGGTSTVLAGRSEGYAFDNIGNRSTTTHNGDTATYTPNALNQYTQRTTPGVIDVAGLAPSSANVTVALNGGTAAAVSTRFNDYYFSGRSAANSTWNTLTMASSLGGSVTRQAFVPPATEAFSYDADGNLKSDGRWDYYYDAENRLIAMQTHLALSPGTIPNADARRLEFTNDYLGRRVRRKVLGGYNGTAYLTTLSDTKFLYDGWNLLAEFDASGSSLAALRLYYWGLDWSGTLQGAGGVGGLLMLRDLATSTTLLPAYDGNGNVMALAKRDNGAIAAVYEYDAFGNALAAYGSHAAANPFRFSTKYTDAETQLVYYGLRYYSPTLGRFINRDPIEEKGGLNLYAFVGNNGINGWDMLGMDPVDAWFTYYGSPNPGPAGPFGTGSTFGYNVNIVGTLIPNSSGKSGPKPLVGIPGYPNRKSAPTDFLSGTSAYAKNVQQFTTVVGGSNVTYKYDPVVKMYVAVAAVPIKPTNYDYGTGSILSPHPNVSPAQQKDPYQRSNYSDADSTAAWHHTIYGFTYSLQNGENGLRLLERVASDIGSFQSFDFPAYNNTGVSINEGVATFDLRGLKGAANDFLSPNDSQWQVALETRWSDDHLSFTQIAHTMGDHPLIGTRTWTVAYDPSRGTLSVSTEAYEQPRSLYNEAAFLVVGANAQREIWQNYFSNLADVYLRAAPNRHFVVDEKVVRNPFYRGPTNGK